MAPTFPNTFDQGSPMTPQSASSISYQTNMNRQKTKKWTQAPAVNYDGDDWGDDDEYGAPPPPSKPTGFRQQGQGMQSSAKPESPAYDSSKKYGELPPLPGANDPRGRSNSFDADDEKRNFSSSTMRQPSPSMTTPTSSAPATRFSQITGVPSSRNPSGPPALQIQTQQPQPQTGLRKASQMVSPVSGSPYPDVLQSGRVNTAESSVVSPASVAPSSASDFQARQDFSPSAVPQPLTTRASPAPQPVTDSPSTRFPARKSSLSQVAGPPLSDITRPSPADSTSRPWVSGPRSASPGASARSPNTPTGKALPFIRPAEIYKRAEEERRQSIESGSRPSIDSATGARASDRSDSPIVINLKEKSSSDSLGASGRRRTSFEGDDGSESGRRLMPMLEPVRERKSEYGFEGINVNEQAPRAGSTGFTHPEESRASAIAHEVDEEEAQKISISPKLPDLNRISGFGVDLFSQPKDEASELPGAKQIETTPTASTATLSPVDEDLKLHSQPSFGFRSIVNQAFDRSNDTSVPPTPVSNTGSGPKRTDSESTGTTGISPIMSRVPSAAAHASRNHDVSNSSILEVVNEPDSPELVTEREAEDTQRGREVPGFKPGYRRDISTPRSDNSPARTPDLAKTKIITSGQHAIISEASPEDTSLESEPLQPPRPIAEREGSFRPSLPGGWTSYATTAQSETGTQAPSLRAQTPVRDVSPIKSAGGGSDLDITPTTTKHSLPQSALGAAVAGAIIAGTTGTALGPHSQDNPISISRSPSRKPVSGSSNPPTPDPSMAPGGNLYSTSNLDPRLLPKLEQAPPETQLRADAVHRDISTQSSAAPTPPPKDSPENNVSDDDSEYFTKATVPLKSRTPVGAEASEALLPPSRPQMLPALSTDIHPNDEENDKLRKEIVKSLSSRPSEATALNDSMLSDEYDESSYPKQGHESTYLPREYDNYWASTSDDQEGADSFPPPVPEHIARAEATEPAMSTSQDRDEVDSPVIAPLSPRRPEQLEQPSLEAPQPPIQSRFSWEGSGENVNVAIPNDQVSEVSAVSTPVYAPQATEEATVAPTVALSDAQSTAREQASPIEPPVQTQATPTNRDSEEFNKKYLLAASGAAAVGAAAAATTYAYTPQDSSERRLSLAEEKDPRVSSHPVSPTSPEDEHPSRQAQPYFTPSPNQNSPVPAPSTVSPVASPVIQQPSTFHTMPPLGFKEIVGIGSTQQRIHTFDLTRERFATMDSGLNDWMAHLQALHPEHAGTGPSFGGSRISVPNGTARSKFGKLTGGGDKGGGGSGGVAPPLQQPYFQHYLNASSPTTPSTPVPRPGSGTASSMAFGSQQGFSSNSGKITTHQVQAKGKELLHSAGIFGGKAGKAGKGLLAKGKNKFRGGDKTSPDPKPKNERPKEDRRTSWGLPLNLTRSPGKPDQSARQSTEFSPQSQRPRAATNTSNRSFTAPQLPDIPTGDSLGIVSGALASSNGTPGQEHQGPATIRQVQEPTPTLEESEARDSLRPPAPIGKYQPSWDPYNATPIAEEEVLQYEDRPTERQERQFSSNVANRQGSLAVPPGIVSGSERSNSDDSHFYSAQEESSDIPNDWVMVAPPNQKTKDAPAQQPAQNLIPEPNVEPDTRKSSETPVTSILNRPRGSSYEIPSPPTSAKGPAPRAAEPPFVAPAPVQQLTPPSKPVQAELEKQSGASSFLPPIRRTSTFGLGFGSRHARPRFPIEDDEEHGVRDNAARPVGMISTPPTQAEDIRAPPQQPSSSLLQGGGIRMVDDYVSPPPGPPPGWQPPASRQAPSPSSQPSQGARPLSFVQSGEILNTPRRSNTQQMVANDPVKLEPPRYQEPTQTREQPLREQPPRDPRPVMNLPQAAPPQDSSPRPLLVQAGSSNYSQQSATGQRPTFSPQVPQQQAFATRIPEAAQRPEQNQRAMPPPQHSRLPPIVTSRASDVLQRPEFRESQVEWRPNRPKAVEQPPLVVSPTVWKEMDMPPPRQSNSWEPQQRPRGYSGSSQDYPQRPDGQYNERAGWAGPPGQNPYPQPPSSAQRYPELFRPGQPGPPGPPGPDGPRENVDLPDHYYQAPLAGPNAFLPRHQANEYQIPGVGPPPEDPRFAGSSKRNSGFFKEIGGKLSRASSRDRRNSESRDRDGAALSPDRPFESQGNEYAESSVASEGEQEQRKRRSSFFGHLTHNSTSGLGPPQSRESVIAHNSASRTDLLNSPQSSPTRQDRKRSFFGGGSKDPKGKPSKLVRSSTGSNTGSMDPPGKKHNRFSGLSSMFGKTSPSAGRSVQGRPQATRELSYNERQPIESPQLGAQRPAMNTPPLSQGRAPSQTRQVLHKLTSSSSPRTSPRPDNKTRRSSGGLLGGLMGGKTKKQDRGSDDSRSQGSSQTLRGPRTLPAAQTYTDLQEQQPMAPPPQQREIPFQDPSLRVADRGRQAGRSLEPQYDNVPIPGGYSLVRGQGAQAVPTQYDPRGLSQMQQPDTRFTQRAPNGQYFPNGASMQGPPQQNDGRYGPGPRPQQPPQLQDPRQKQQPKLNLSAIETYETFAVRTAPRRLSREDLLARSPPKSLEGQQRPYQLSLPGGDEEERPIPLEKDRISPPTNQTPVQQRPQHDAIQRLQQPVLRHPESPAGYPLPEDTVFSPVDPRANDIPPPPPPQWPGTGRMGSQGSNTSLQHGRQLSLTTMDGDLDRSNTRRTAVSAVSGLSGLSGSRPQSGGLNVPDRQISDATERDGGRGGRGVVSPSPSPPSPMPGTPERTVSPDPRDHAVLPAQAQHRQPVGDIRNTEVMLSRRSREDLYDASPRLPKQINRLPKEMNMSSPPPPAISNGNGHAHANISPPTTTRGSLQPLGKENMNVNRSASAAVNPTAPSMAEGNVMRAASSSQAGLGGHTEEKILYQDRTAGRAELPSTNEDDGEPEMVATSYPGMEWNPYAAGAWDDGFD